MYCKYAVDCSECFEVPCPYIGEDTDVEGEEEDVSDVDCDPEIRIGDRG